MKKLFEIREKLIVLYNKVDAFVIPVLKFICAMIVLHTINSRMGYFARIDNIAIELIASLLCSFLPSGMILVFAGLFTLLHMYELSLVVLILGVILYLILYLLFLRFAPKASIVVAITPILMMWKIPYVLPIILGLVAAPGSAVAAGCGIIAYTFLKIVNTNATSISTMELSDALAQLKLIVDALISSKGMVVVIVAFAVTIIAVYFLKRLPIKRNWEIAIGAGVVIDLLALLIGDVIIDTGISFINIFLVSILAAAIGFVIKFFRFCVDFGRTENVQFEDDDYYYYVKAVPKINLGIAKGKVKKINKSHGRSKYVQSNIDDDIYNDGIDESYLYDYDENGDLISYDENGNPIEYYEEGNYTEEGYSEGGYSEAGYSEEGYSEDGFYDENGSISSDSYIDDTN